MVSLLASLVLILAAPCISWTSSAYMDLISPPRWTTDIGDRYIIKAGEIQEGYTNALTSCLNLPVPSNVTRTPFPINGGSIVFGFVNDTASPNPDPVDEKFWLDMYLSSDQLAHYSSDYFFNFGNFKRMRYWQGFQTGWTCSVGIDVASRLKQPTNETALALLEGMNITVALLIHLGRGPYRGDPNWGGYTWDEVHQCAYITLTSKPIGAKRDIETRDENADMCSRVNLDYFHTPTTTAPLGPSSTSKTSRASEKTDRRARTFLTSTTFILALLNS
ncbi:hypothetical protein VTL71DRAFT_3393 [Oculimacula yallundae]|uniref:Uncharacterized protein n=1 Tax=Oculimacula yallundae TaxID=86028 RepID=A0ABR4C973_9HELO